MTELEIAITEFLEACHRTGKHNTDDNIEYFLLENNHMGLDQAEVNNLFYEFDC